ncbi:hypothetical protein BDZ85DRAFT_267320, partial [Elsinoe ampelina]
MCSLHIDLLTSRNENVRLEAMQVCVGMILSQGFLLVVLDKMIVTSGLMGYSCRYEDLDTSWAMLRIDGLTNAAEMRAEDARNEM